MCALLRRIDDSRAQIVIDVAVYDRTEVRGHALLPIHVGKWLSANWFACCSVNCIEIAILIGLQQYLALASVDFEVGKNEVCISIEIPDIAWRRLVIPAHFSRGGIYRDD